jgi:hypothetical protein
MATIIKSSPEKPRSNGVYRSKELMLVDFDETIMFDNSALSSAGVEVTGKLLRRSEIKGLEDETRRGIYLLAADKYAYVMRPNHKIIELMGSEIAKKDVIILTARLDDIADGTLKLLRTYLVPFDELILRESDLAKMRDEVWKTNQVYELLKTYSKIDLYEDKLDNISYICRVLMDNRINYFGVSPNEISLYSRYDLGGWSLWQ